jgi:hypothetical protein
VERRECGILCSLGGVFGSCSICAPPCEEKYGASYRPRASYSRVQQHHEILGSPDRSKSQQLVSNPSNKRSIRVGQRAKMQLYTTWIGLREGPRGGDCYGELPRILLPRTRVNKGEKGQGVMLRLFALRLASTSLCSSCLLWRSTSFAVSHLSWSSGLRGSLALLASAPRMRLAADTTFPCLLRTHPTPKPRATQYLSEKIVHTEVVLRVDVRHMWFRTEGELSPPCQDKCVCEKAGFFLIKTRN